MKRLLLVIVSLFALGVAGHLAFAADAAPAPETSAAKAAVPGRPATVPPPVRPPAVEFGGSNGMFPAQPYIAPSR